MWSEGFTAPDLFRGGGASINDSARCDILIGFASGLHNNLSRLPIKWPPEMTAYISEVSRGRCHRIGRL